MIKNLDSSNYYALMRFLTWQLYKYIVQASLKKHNLLILNIITLATKVNPC